MYTLLHYSTMVYYEISIVLLLLVLFCYFLQDKRGVPTYWPLVGMLPALLKNVHRIHAFSIEVLEKHHLTFFLKGPWFTKMNILVTVDPANVQHVMINNFGNYPKGPKFREKLDVLGDSVSTLDYTEWQYHRKMSQSFLAHPKFHSFLVKKTWEKVENGLIPLLDHASKHGVELDLQDMFVRFTFDTICTIIMDHNPKSLSLALPNVPSCTALDEVEEVIFYRHVVPTFVWKFQRWLKVGKEYKYMKACETLDSFIYNCIAEKRRQINGKGRQTSSVQNEGNEVHIDLLTTYMQENESKNPSHGNQGDRILRDMIVGKFLAGRDTISSTLSWFFYLLTKHPKVLSKIKKELDNALINKINFKEANYNKLLYLHAAFCETLRLYPPFAFGAKNPIAPDVLPSGHHVNRTVQIIFNVYAMGRIKSIWGEDCYEFKPERWISKKGELRHEPSYKFFSFNSGPRTCLGKEMAFTQMKIIAATIIQNYVVEAVEEHHVVPDISMILHMKYGFKVRVFRSSP